MAGLVKFTPMLLRLIVGLVVWAVNLYQTSYVGETAQSPLTVIDERVAPYMLPVTLLQVVDDVNVTTLAQSLLAGAGSSIHIVKFPVVTVDDMTLTK
jgi:hypothetical protein